MLKEIVPPALKIKSRFFRPVPKNPSDDRPAFFVGQEFLLRFFQVPCRNE
jgi:hypothetical protein